MRRLLVAAVAVVVLVAAAVVLWAAVIRDDPPAAFELSDTSARTTEATTRGSDAVEIRSPEELDGTWTVAEGSEAGYRVIEDLGDVLDFEAVGRTSQVTGSIEIDGARVPSGSFDVDIASITSDDGRRDNQFRGPIMAAEEFPTATFLLTEEIDFGEAPSSGEVVRATATGELTLRGTTNTVTFDVDAQLLGDRIELVGAIDVLFSDYGIANPSNPLVEVRDEGMVEFLLLLAPA